MRAGAYKAGGARHRSQGDIFFPNVVLGLDCDGTAGSPFFPDWSSYVQATNQHNAVVDTSNALFGTGAAIFAGNHNISAADAPSLALNTGDITLEVAVKMVSFTFSGIVFIKCLTTGFFPWQLAVLNTGQLRLQCYDNTNTLIVNISGPFLSLGVYYRFAVTRDTANNLMALWVDGVAVGSASVSAGTTLYVDNGNVYFGQFSTFVAPIDAYMDEIRFSNVCRYPGTTTYTPATAAFPHFV